MQYSSKPKTALVRKAEQRKAVPFSIVAFNDKAEMDAWKSKFETEANERSRQSQSAARTRAIGMYLAPTPPQVPRSRETTTQQPKEAWLKRMVSTIKHWCLMVWRNAGFDNY